jgi:membrane protease YdiL (CAAX protease family)
LNFAANIGSAPFITSLGLSFATAFSEETAFRGYVFTRIWAATKNEWVANLVTSGLWTAVHVPIAFFVWQLSLSAGLTYLALTAVFGVGSAFVYARTRNIVSPILLHVLWEWPIILFR